MPATPTRPHSLLLSTSKTSARLLPIADLTSLVTTDNTTPILTKGETGTKGLPGTTVSPSYVASSNTISLTNGESIEWSAPVVSICRVTPFIVTLLSNVTVEIHQESTLLSLQIITLLSPPVRIMTTKPLTRGYLCPIPLYRGGVPEDVFLYVDMSGVDASNSTSMSIGGLGGGGGKKSGSSGNEVFYLTMTPLSQQVKRVYTYMRIMCISYTFHTVYSVLYCALFLIHNTSYIYNR